MVNKQNKTEVISESNQNNKKWKASLGLIWWLECGRKHNYPKKTNETREWEICGSGVVSGI